MVLSIFLFLNILLFIIFCCYRKRLHLFEILFIWMVAWLNIYSISSILTVNLKVIEVADNQSAIWNHFFLRLFLYPLIITIFFDIYVWINTLVGKAVLFAVNIGLMSILEYTSIHLGILKEKRNFHVSISLMEWSFTVLLSFLLWIWYRKKRLER